MADSLPKEYALGQNTAKTQHKCTHVQIIEEEAASLVVRSLVMKEVLQGLEMEEDYVVWK